MLENSETIAENDAKIPENSEEFQQNSENSEKRGRGRPKGARDSAPRRPRTVIIEEPPEPVIVEQPVQKRAPKPKAEPLSPRAIFHQASATIAAMQTEREKARRAYWSETIAKSLR